MQRVPDSTKSLVDNYGKVTLRAYLDGMELTAGLGAVSYAAACGSPETFSIGSSCAAGVTLTLAEARGNMEGLPFRMTWDVDGTEYPLFAGTVDTAEVSGGRTAVTAYDAIYFAGGNAFIPAAELLTDCTAWDALQALGTALGVPVDAGIQDDAMGIPIPGGLQNLQDGATVAQTLGYVAAIMGGNAVITRDGALTVRGYPATGWETEVYSGGAAAKNLDYTVTGVQFTRPFTTTKENADGTTSETAGTEVFTAGTNPLTLENPLAAQAHADLAWQKLSGITVRKGKYSFPGGLLLEPGDLYTAVTGDGDYITAAVDIRMCFDGGVKTDTTCGGGAITGGSPGSIGQALKALELDVARIKTLQAENARINSANIEVLRARKLTAEDIEAGTITADKINLEDLMAQDITATGDFQVNNGAWEIRTLPEKNGVAMGCGLDEGETQMATVVCRPSKVEITAGGTLGTVELLADTIALIGEMTLNGTAIESLFAPGDCGLGASAPRYTDAAELDSLVGCRFFSYFNTAAPLVDGDTNTRSAVGISLAYSAAYGMQIAFCANNGAKLVRRKHSGVWGPWLYENPPMEAGVEYATTEKRDGEIVYRKRVTYKNEAALAPAGGIVTVSVPHGISGFGQSVRVHGKVGSNLLPHMSGAGSLTTVTAVGTDNITVRSGFAWGAGTGWDFDLAYTKAQGG